MNATALAQSEFDNRLPPPVSESPLELARAESVSYTHLTLPTNREV